MHELILKDNNGKVYTVKGNNVKYIVHEMLNYIIRKYQIRGLKL